MVLAQATKPREASAAAGRTFGQTDAGSTRNACTDAGTSSPRLIKEVNAVKTASGLRFIVASARTAPRRISPSESALKAHCEAPGGGVNGLFKSGSARS